MEVIRELERRPRGIYTGAMGYLSPGSLRQGKLSRRALFNVAIRTVAIRKKTHQAEYGVGGGVVWDSNATSEYGECMTKARILTTCRSEFSLLETIRWDPGRGYFLLDPHLGRLEESAEYFDFAYPAKRISAALQKAAAGFSERTHRVRLLLGRRGHIHVEATPIERQPGRHVVRVAIDDRPVDSSNPFLYHKTTNRSLYAESAARHPGFDDVILFNERGELTESCLANLVVQLGGKRYTPPVSCGLLPGIYRGFLLGRRRIAERILLPSDLKHADSIWLINSVREWIPAMMAANDRTGGPVRR
jgi:para-aminobenzoate synthetase/4-amino-4-deoxychorismate lyase